MATIKLKHVNSFYDRHHKLRHLVRVPGQKAKTLPGVPGSEEFMASYQAALAMGPAETGASRSKPGSFDALIKQYYKSKVFTDSFADATQRMRRAILERWRADHGAKRVAHLQAKHVRDFLEQKKPYAQKNWLKTLRGLMLFAIAQNYRADDPTAGLNAAKPGVKSHGHMTWQQPEIDAYRNRHALGTVARLAIELMLNIAARRGDAWELGPQHIKNGKLCWRPNKTKRSTGKLLSIPILSEFQAALDAMPVRDAAFLVNDYGRRFKSAAAFGNKFADWCRQAGLRPVKCDDGKVRSYRAHGLRKAALMALVRARCDVWEIMAISGHSTLSQVQVYVDEFNREQKAEDAMNKLAAAARR
jgi:integrase